MNFKDFDKYGFANHFTKTVSAVRAVNFDTDSHFKQNNINNRLQLRVGARDSVGNIVGFMIPTNTKSIQCIKLLHLRLCLYNGSSPRVYQILSNLMH